MATPEPSSPSSSSNATPLATTPSAVPPPLPLDTHPNRGSFRRPSGTSTDPNRLAPEDAYRYISPPRLRPLHEITGLDPAAASLAAAALRPAVASLRAPPAIPPVQARLEQERKRNQSRKRRRPKVFKKLLWIRSEYPDNHTDATSFLDHLERPRLRPYDFWPLVADSAVIVQHVCSLVIFVSAYAAIYQDRLSPVAVVTCGTVATVVGWILWDRWMGQEDFEYQSTLNVVGTEVGDGSNGNPNGSVGPNANGGHTNGHVNGHAKITEIGKGLGLSLSTANLTAKNYEQGLHAPKHGQSLSKSSFQSISPIDPLSEQQFPDLNRVISQAAQIPRSPTTLPQSISHRNQVRLKTLKSALLIYFTLLGLSPILKSLTKSTSSDSIWALATWLLIINVFFFDYGSVYVPQHRKRPAPTTTKPPIYPSPDVRPATGSTTLARAMSLNDNDRKNNNNNNNNQHHNGTNDNQQGASSGTTNTGPIKGNPTAPFPSSLSTNAALMASTVLASRLPTTTAVFSLSLFSIQVFGLFPVFRQHLRHKSAELHAALTLLLIFMSTAGLSLVLSRSYTHTHGDCGYCFRWLWHVAVRSVVGVAIGGSTTLFIMGACSWWLIGLQRYKNVVIGPWDPAKPVLAGGIHLHGGRGRGGTE